MAHAENKQTQLKAIKVTADVHRLMKLVHKQVVVESGGEILTINDALKYVLEERLDRDE